MSKIIKLEGTEVYIGMDDQKIVKAPISAVNYPNPQVGDEIRIFKDGDTTIIARAAAAAPAVPAATAAECKRQRWKCICSKRKAYE